MGKLFCFLILVLIIASVGVEANSYDWRKGIKESREFLKSERSLPISRKIFDDEDEVLEDGDVGTSIEDLTNTDRVVDDGTGGGVGTDDTSVETNDETGETDGTVVNSVAGDDMTVDTSNDAVDDTFDNPNDGVDDTTDNTMVNNVNSDILSNDDTTSGGAVVVEPTGEIVDLDKNDDDGSDRTVKEALDEPSDGGTPGEGGLGEGGMETDGDNEEVPDRDVNVNGDYNMRDDNNGYYYNGNGYYNTGNGYYVGGGGTSNGGGTAAYYYTDDSKKNKKNNDYSMYLDQFGNIIKKAGNTRKGNRRGRKRPNRKQRKNNGGGSYGGSYDDQNRFGCTWVLRLQLCI